MCDHFIANLCIYGVLLLGVKFCKMCELLTLHDGTKYISHSV